MMRQFCPVIFSLFLLSIAGLSSGESIPADQIERTFEIRVSRENDDCEESNDGKMHLASTDLELINDGVDQTVGLRFQNVEVPRGATITSAYVQFYADEVGTGSCRLTIRGQAADDPAFFTDNPHDLSSRSVTTASAAWDPPEWRVEGETGPDQRTSDIAPVIQEIVSREGWKAGHAMVIVITGTGTRTARSYGGTGINAPLLHIEYSAPADPSAVMIRRRTQVRVSQDNDDCEEGDGGRMYLASSDLELINDGHDQTVGLRFQNVDVPRGATITGAYVQFYVDEISTGGCTLEIRGQAADDPAVFTDNPHDLSSRPVTAASATWDPPEWHLEGETGPDQRTSDIAPVIREIVSREGWNGGNAVVIIITGKGTRTAESYGGAGAKAALLQIEYETLVSNAPSVEIPSRSIFDILGATMRERNLALEFGVYNFGLNYAEDGEAALANRREGDVGYTSGYGIARYVTDPWHGFRLGAGGVAVFDIHQKDQSWAEQTVDRDRYYLKKVQFYYQKGQLHEAFLQYGISRSYVKVGRQRMNAMRFGYDAAEGISLIVNQIHHVSFTFDSFWRGLEDVGYDEISHWGTVREHEGRRGEQAAEAVYMTEASITTPGRWLRLRPYYHVQNGFMNAMGARADLTYRRGGVKYRLAFETIKVEETTIYVDYDASWDAFVIVPRIEFSWLRIEGGYHKMSEVEDGKIPAYAYWMNNLNPMENGKRVLQSSAKTYFARMAYEWKRLNTRIRYAKSNASSGFDAEEWGYRLRYDLTRHLEVELQYHDYDDELPEAEYTKVEALLRFRF